MIDFKQKVVDLIKGEVEELNEEEVNLLVEIPPSYDMGDYAFPTFRLAKSYRKAPNMIAEELAAKFDDNEDFEKVQNVGPYVNFFINKNKSV